MSLVTTRSALARSAIAPLIESLRPAAKTATKTTSASPTMSAAAVTAVRAGLRVALSRASSPGRVSEALKWPADDSGERAHDVARAQRDADEHE